MASSARKVRPLTVPTGQPTGPAKQKTANAAKAKKQKTTAAQMKLQQPTPFVHPRRSAAAAAAASAAPPPAVCGAPIRLELKQSVGKVADQSATIPTAPSSRPSVWCNPASTVCHFFVVNGQAPMFLDVFDSNSAGIWQYVTKFSVRLIARDVPGGKPRRLRQGYAVSAHRLVDSNLAVFKINFARPGRAIGLVKHLFQFEVRLGLSQDADLDKLGSSDVIACTSRLFKVSTKPTRCMVISNGASEWTPALLIKQWPALAKLPVEDTGKYNVRSSLGDVGEVGISYSTGAVTPPWGLNRPYPTLKAGEAFELRFCSPTRCLNFFAEHRTPMECAGLTLHLLPTRVQKNEFGVPDEAPTPRCKRPSPTAAAAPASASSATSSSSSTNAAATTTTKSSRRRRRTPDSDAAATSTTPTTKKAATMRRRSRPQATKKQRTAAPSPSNGPTTDSIAVVVINASQAQQMALRAARSRHAVAAPPSASSTIASTSVQAPQARWGVAGSRRMYIEEEDSDGDESIGHALPRGVVDGGFEADGEEEEDEYEDEDMGRHSHRRPLRRPRRPHGWAMSQQPPRVAAHSSMDIVNILARAAEQCFASPLKRRAAKLAQLGLSSGGGEYASDDEVATAAHHRRSITHAEVPRMRRSTSTTAADDLREQWQVPRVTPSKEAARASAASARRVRARLAARASAGHERISDAYHRHASLMDKAAAADQQQPATLATTSGVASPFANVASPPTAAAAAARVGAAPPTGGVPRAAGGPVASPGAAAAAMYPSPMSHASPMMRALHTKHRSQTPPHVSRAHHQQVAV